MTVDLERHVAPHPHTPGEGKPSWPQCEEGLDWSLGLPAPPSRDRIPLPAPKDACSPTPPPPPRLAVPTGPGPPAPTCSKAQSSLSEAWPRGPSSLEPITSWKCPPPKPPAVTGGNSRGKERALGPGDSGSEEGDTQQTGRYRNRAARRLLWELVSLGPVGLGAQACKEPA